VFGLRSDPIVELVLGSDPRSGVWVGPPPPFLRLGWGGTPSQPHQMGSDPILGIVLGEDPSTPVCFGVGTFDCLFVSYSSPVQNPKSRMKPLKIVLGEGPTSDHGVRVGVLPQRNAGRRGGDPTQSSTTGSQGHRAGHRTGSGSGAPLGWTREVDLPDLLQLLSCSCSFWSCCERSCLVR